MSQPIVLSGEEDGDSTPYPIHSKKRRTGSDAFFSICSTVIVLDDDPSTHKSGRNSPPPSYDVVIVKCMKAAFDFLAEDLNTDQKFDG